MGRGKGRTVILHANQGCHDRVAERFKRRIRPHRPKGVGDVGPEEAAEIADERP